MRPWFLCVIERWTDWIQIWDKDPVAVLVWSGEAITLDAVCTVCSYFQVKVPLTPQFFGVYTLASYLSGEGIAVAINEWKGNYGCKISN